MIETRCITGLICVIWLLLVNLYRGCRDVSLHPRGFRETLGDSVRFTLRRVELMDAGRMTIEAKNLFGLERVSVSVKVSEIFIKVKVVFQTRSFSLKSAVLQHMNVTLRFPSQLS